MVPGHPHNPTSRINKPQALCFLPEFRIANTWVRCYGCGLRDFGPVGTKGRCQGKPRRDGEAKEIRPTASARRVSIIGLMLVHAVMSSSIQVHTGGGNRHNVLVTGANRGLGLEIARGFVQLGHCVIITSRDTAAGTQAAFALQEQGSDVVYHPLDLASKTSIQSLISSCMNGKLPTPTILVNNGAICLEGDSREILSHTLAVNYYGAKYLTEGLLAHVAARGREGEKPKFLGSRSLGNVRTFVMEAMGWDTKVPQGGSAGSLCVVNVSSGDGEVAFLCSGLQDALGAVQTLEEGDSLAQQLADNLLLPDQELAFGENF